MLFNVLNNVLNNHYATKLCCDYFEVAQAWDDLIDRDKELSDKEIHRAFALALVDIPNNPFYIQHSLQIQPVVGLSICKWLTANKYEDENNLVKYGKAYMLRAGLYDLFAQCYIILYGITELTKIYDIYGETIQDYLKEMECQTQLQQ